MDSASVYQWLLTSAASKGIVGAADSCNLNKCGPGKQLPVQVWRRHDRSEEDALAWQLCRPAWKKSDYTIVKKYKCFFHCENKHFHHCAVGHCNSADCGMTVENNNGNRVCLTSGRVVQITTEYDWREKKKGQFAPRRARQINPGAQSSMLFAKSKGPQSSTTAESVARIHNTVDLKMMQTASRVVMDCLFSKMRQEFYSNARRTKKQSIEIKAQQTIKRNRRENKITYVAELNLIGISHGWFSNSTYENVVKAQDPRACTQTVAPLLVALYKKINSFQPNQPVFKSFLSFSIAALFCTIRGVNLLGIQIIPQYRNMLYLLPLPSQVESLSRSLWSFYADGSPSQQQNFLTRTQNQIRAAFNSNIKTVEDATVFVNDLRILTVMLREQYGDVVITNLFF